MVGASFHGLRHLHRGPRAPAPDKVDSVAPVVGRSVPDQVGFLPSVHAHIAADPPGRGVPRSARPGCVR